VTTDTDTTPHSEVRDDRDYQRDTNYVHTRITRDGRDGYPVQPGRYRLIAARACPWANRAIIVRRLLGLEAKMRQYRDGAAFVRAVVDKEGTGGFAAVWQSPDTLPTAAEITDPAAWGRRVLG